jgi:predicted helicase
MHKTSIVQEDRRSGIEIAGIPDFFVWNDDNTLFKSLIGFIECKKPTYNIENLIDSEQIKKYSKTSQNIIITNYKRFILLQSGKIQHDITLAADTKTLLDFITLLQDFYGYKYPYIKTKQTLANSLAAQSFYYSVILRQYIDNKTNQRDSFYIKFNGLYTEYERSINFHYILADFCDIYSQTLVYGLLLARLDKGKQLDEHRLNYLENIPEQYGFLYEFLEQGYQSRSLPTEIKTALTNIGKNINLIDTDAITKEFQSLKNGKNNIAVYLYEDFLTEYDKFRGTENRREGGVYYTPQEATDFITRAVNHLLKISFDLPNGYNSENVKVLDFACGTGSFIQSVFQQMIPENPDKLEINTLKNKILKDIYGFELLFTPYIIAHTFLSRFLIDRGIRLDNERLKIYLTNTLDISSHTISDFMPILKSEYEKAREIKDNENILAIMGNPPYFNGKSRAKSDVIDVEIQKININLREKKSNNQDAYLKFMVFATRKISKNGFGVVGIIVNNSWLYGTTRRLMRKYFYDNFTKIYILNSHGDSDRKDPDKNIFDIKRGISIVFFVKEQHTNSKQVFYASTLDKNLMSRPEKLNFLKNTEFQNIDWQEVFPTQTEDFWFLPKDYSQQTVYNSFWKLTDIFNLTGSAVSTDRDDLMTNYSENNLLKNIEYAFGGKYTDEFKEKFNIYNSSGYDFETRIESQKMDDSAVIDYLYRPFDSRKIYYKVGFTSRPGEKITQHFIGKINVGLAFKKQLNRNIFNTVLAVNKVTDRVVLETSHGGAYIAPLYTYTIDIETDEVLKTPNFTDAFLKFIHAFASPEDILAYIYAILHSNVYRTKYIEFLKTDFPAVPFTSNKEIFYKYSELGQKLIDLHLLKNLPTDRNIRVNYDFDGDFYIKKVVQDNDKLYLYTSENKTITFENVTSEIYNFEIGSYKPIDKWLKYRIKDNVSLGTTDLQHLKNMIIALKNTILVMIEIEELGEEYLK